ncbi:DMT family transporter [Moorena sp. SIO4E2]|uniref:DMT family transporter n=1 Tax=Moorena sp. SIO4E2 TaxID=2607826 RepID=UPI00257B7A03|nr:DMT family transporter [Moorena sp. SIO4E2]
MISTKHSAVWGSSSLAIAIFALSSSPILTRITEHDMGPYGTIFNRFWIASLALGLGKVVKLLWDKQSGRLSTTDKKAYTVQDFFSLFLVASLDSICLVTWAWSLTKTSVANSNLLHNTTPIFAAVGGWLLLSQSFNRRFLIGMILALGGTFLIGFNDFHIDRDTLIGDSVALLSALFYAATLLVTEHLRVKFDTSTILLWLYTLGGLLLLPLTLLFEDRLFPASFSSWSAVIGLGLCGSIIGLGALFYSLKQFSSSFVSLILLLEPMIAAVLAWLIFAEKLSWLNGLTFIIVLSGIYLAKSDGELDNIGSTEVT